MGFQTSDSLVSALYRRVEPGSHKRFEIEGLVRSLFDSEAVRNPLLSSRSDLSTGLAAVVFCQTYWGTAQARWLSRSGWRSLVALRQPAFDETAEQILY